MELELFPLFDMEAIKSGAKKNKLSTSVKLQTLQGENINSEEELQANSLHVRMTYKNLDFAEKNIKEHEFENCTFESCHFVKANLTAVAFMDCKFQNCDFVVPTLVNTGIKPLISLVVSLWASIFPIAQISFSHQIFKIL